ncbi:hypothetical protein Nepgr_000583 [Nepenthes gracilis]|uniref:Cytochrome b561 and DOMON domain-containing protein n=1 Tax=Nepenthes gracilis TaxID=150966 RepID=A0AAD3RWB5_NEPGR|nr:hypothetical protein Nepgr_000583 [Nepenthes gracilis]
MKRALKAALLSRVLFLLCVFSTTRSQSCSSYTFSNNRLYSACTDLPFLNAFLHWTYYPSSGTADVAFRVNGVSISNWVAWAINPTGVGMQGAQALVAVQNSSGILQAYTSNVQTYETTLAESLLSFSVSSLSAEMSGNQMMIFATVQLPDNNTSVTQVWQVGPVTGGSPQPHAQTGDNLKSVGSVDLLSGQVASSGAGGSRETKKNVHGVLNAVSWGTLIPIGVMIARYMKVFKAADPAWFYLHSTCQTSAYIIGVAGWGTGLKLGSDSPGVVYHTHRNIGITLFCLGTLQVIALLLRPKKDHKNRFYWNIYHYFIGYTVIILSIINVFKGLDILDPTKKWKKAYIGILIFLGCIALVLEGLTWFLVLKRKKMAAPTPEKYSHTHSDIGGADEGNGYGI